jgi:putative peptide maturation dehydrogenase
VATSILTGDEHEVTLEELELLLRLPVEGWEECDEPLLDGLLAKGLAVAPGTEAAARDELLAASQWNLFGALYHARGRWHDVDVQLHAPDEIDFEALSRATRAWIEAHGAPPTHLPPVAETSILDLSRPERHDGVFATLARRRTSRRFDRSARVSEEQLALLLHTVYGIQGVTRIVDDVVGVRRTSPSGGGLHPIEAYPLVLEVDGVDPGLYHYHAGRHALELLEPMAESAARDLAVRFVCGQGYFRDASVLVIMAARFERSFWKYRRHEKAYGVALMDAGHLSQTFYLVCAELELGAFVTAAVNNADIDVRLGLDGFAEGSLAISGCGPLVAESSELQPAFEPFSPTR